VGRAVGSGSSGGMMIGIGWTGGDCDAVTRV
jgi:hypothetical protein